MFLYECDIFNTLVFLAENITKNKFKKLDKILIT